MEDRLRVVPIFSSRLPAAFSKDRNLSSKHFKRNYCEIVTWLIKDFYVLKMLHVGCTKCRDHIDEDLKFEYGFHAESFKVVMLLPFDQEGDGFIPDSAVRLFLVENCFMIYMD